MNILEQNQNIIIKLKDTNEHIGDLQLVDNKVIHNNREVPIDKVDLSFLTSESLDLSVLYSDDIINIIKIYNDKNQIVSIENNFYNKLNSPEPLKNEQKELSNRFNSYIEQLLLYKNYLTQDLNNILNKFEMQIEILSTLNDTELNGNQTSELNIYYSMKEKVEQEIKRINNTQAQLCIKKNNEFGHISIGSIALLVIATLSLISIIIGLIIK